MGLSIIYARVGYYLVLQHKILLTYSKTYPINIVAKAPRQPALHAVDNP